MHRRFVDMQAVSMFGTSGSLAAQCSRKAVAAAATIGTFRRIKYWVNSKKNLVTRTARILKASRAP